VVSGKEFILKITRIFDPSMSTLLLHAALASTNKIKYIFLIAFVIDNREDLDHGTGSISNHQFEEWYHPLAH
jgi:hypothetical protein